MGITILTCAICVPIFKDNVNIVIINNKCVRLYVRSFVRSIVRWLVRLSVRVFVCFFVQCTA